MKIKQEKGITGIDIVVSVLLITIFITLITNLSLALDRNAKIIQRNTEATSYGIKEIESIKSQGYLEEYEGKGISGKEILKEKEIYDQNNTITGYHAIFSIQDYQSFDGKQGKIANQVKKIVVEISFKVGNQVQKVELETLIAKER